MCFPEDEVVLMAADWWTALCHSAYLLPADVFAVIVSAFLFPMMLSGRRAETHLQDQKGHCGLR